MIAKFVAAFDAERDALRARFKAQHPQGYAEIVRVVVEVLSGTSEYGAPDPERITSIDHGSYQGTLLFIVGAKGYQPDDYWYVRVGYGSCSGCDTLNAIRSYSDEPPTDEQANDYLTLALHIVQGIKPMQEDK